MEPFPLSETTKLENLHQRFKRACRNKDYRKLLRRESRKDLYLNTHAKDLPSKDDRRFGPFATTWHPSRPSPRRPRSNPVTSSYG
ncbi:hypothetical protein Pst134EA_019652 [Puccinia striiformis f. sp. tritici]|uniref:hypothetical protein n=1 Tax=Puccinia striiformis f. sp. tritici TaxID=168172 RepID=UPI002008B57C|nr:hypothetical protein Pst134EA_019652 [Puccinia striiformis f. sp. tritici]KAH9449748.1 hypothetical protein Pst134EB_020564 [Puccinia striiformis f. sp. tritici]KAH9459501.1 hypothetical protein Pst134EA_019652 [Puccinia striiformis f. sp. tritici]